MAQGINMAGRAGDTWIRRSAFAVLEVFRYELARCFTLWRGLLWLGMVVVPLVLLLTVAWLTRGRIPGGDESALVYSMMLFYLVPQVMTMLGMLLLASPVVSSEIESQSWVYALVRQGGRRSLVLGKYFVAVLWTASAGVVVSTLAIPFLPVEDPARLWVTMLVLCVLSSVAYGALFMLLGVLRQKKVMVLAFVYALLVEGFLGWIPAVINQFIFSYRLRSILFRWMDFRDGKVMAEAQVIAEDPTGWVQIGWVFLMSGVCLAVALWWVERCGVSSSVEA
jgi:ABC-type transport system involved in multi-copper enzyme maturation permease subunit